MKYPNIPDHPEIARALETGYPNPPKELPAVYCADCGRELTGEDDVYLYHGDCLCEECVKNRIAMDISTSDLAYALGILRVLACDLADALGIPHKSARYFDGSLDGIG